MKMLQPIAIASYLATIWLAIQVKAICNDWLYKHKNLAKFLILKLVFEKP